MSKVTLKMVAGQSYGSPLFKGRVLQKGDTIAVDADKAEHFINDGYSDSANNFHPYFAVVDEESAAPAKGRGKASKAAEDDEGADGGDGAEGGEDNAQAPAGDAETKSTSKSRRRAG